VAARGAGAAAAAAGGRSGQPRSGGCVRRRYAGLPQRTLGLQLVVANARTESDLETAFATFLQQRVGAVLIGGSTLFNRRTEQLAALAARHALPAIFQYREQTLAGGVVSYGTSISYMYRQIGIYTGRILRGEKPGDLPVQQATKLELVINLKTAFAGYAPGGSPASSLSRQ
jgi:putative ABC transport system substrate-binding protein